MSRIAVINAGSSSIKFAVYRAGSDLPLLLKGQIEGIGAKPRARLSDAQGETLLQEELPEKGFDHAAAVRTMMQITAPRLEGRGHFRRRTSRCARRAGIFRPLASD